MPKLIQRHREQIAALNAALAEHAEFGDLFQPGGRFYREAQLPLGRSAVVEGGRWLVAQLDDLRAAFAAHAVQCPQCQQAAILAASPSPPETQEPLRVALELIANGGPLTGLRTGPMKMYQAQAVAREALALSSGGTPKGESK